MADETKKPMFLGQPLLLLAPVLVLIVVGLNSLRLDRVQAHREASERAQQQAETLITEIAGALSSTNPDRIANTLPAFELDSSGRLLFPPPAAAGLTPNPLLVSRLTAEQARAWQSAQTLERQGKSAEAVQAYENALALKLPTDFAGNAAYSVVLLWAAQGEKGRARDELMKLVVEQSEAKTESGLPLQPLVRLKLLEWQEDLPSSLDRPALLEGLYSNVVHFPTALTPALMREAARFAASPAEQRIVTEWTRTWQEHEQSRRLYAAAVPSPASNTPSSHAFWFSLPKATNLQDSGNPMPERANSAETWLAICVQQASSGCRFVSRTESQVSDEVSAIMRRTERVPYLGSAIEIAGRSLISPRTADSAGGSGGHNERSAELLASATGPSAGGNWLRANVYLLEPAVLYAHQKARLLWFGSLIAICALAALIGLIANWRALQRQQRLSELKSDFVSSVSHELRTPVASVRLLIESLESGRVSGPVKQHEYLRLMGQECRRLSALIENILDYSRIEQGRKHFEFKPTDVPALVEQTVKIIEPYAAERKVLLALAAGSDELASTDAQPCLDGLAIQQALLNLIDNAIKHSPEGETVTVGLNWVASKGGIGAKSHENPRGVALWVEDHGAGIPAEEQEKIFERFYRRGSELRRETQGIGIGLTIVKNIVEAHGGRVLLRSAPGQGSRFTIELPLHRNEASYEQRERTHSAG